jgi:predicted HNH restriction endonuclease
VTPEGVEAEIIQLHHTEPLHGLGKQGTSMGLSEAISKLIPLCPTCHQIAHVEKPPLTVGAIKKLRNAWKTCLYVLSRSE